MTPEPGERALVVGAGTGYSAAVLAAIGLEVVALESSAELAAQARALGVEVVEGRSRPAGAKGAPYDLILIDGAVEDIPDALVDQLADGGRLGAALIDRGVTRLIVGRKAGGAFGYLSLGDAASPALPASRARRHSHSKGVSRVFRKLSHRIADRRADGRHRLGRHAARGAGLGLSAPTRR